MERPKFKHENEEVLSTPFAVYAFIYLQRMYLSVCKGENSIYTERRICVPKRKAVSSRQGSGDKEMVLTLLYRQRVTVRHCLWIASLPPNKKFTHRKWGRSVSLRHVTRGSMPRSGVTENCDVHNHQPCSASSLHKTDRSETLRPHFL